MLNKMSFILDVDGVLSTGQFLYSADGKAFKIFGPHDADGLKMIRDQIAITFISSDRRGFSISERRVKDLGFSLTYVTEQDRYDFIKKNYGLEQVIYMGDGIHDVPLIRDCKFGIAPASARVEAKAVADFVTESNAGEGAVLDACLKIKEVFLTEK